MKITELMARLQQIHQELGDLPVCLTSWDDNPIELLEVDTLPIEPSDDTPTAPAYLVLLD